VLPAEVDPTILFATAVNVELPGTATMSSEQEVEPIPWPQLQEDGGVPLVQSTCSPTCVPQGTGAVLVFGDWVIAHPLGAESTTYMGLSMSRPIPNELIGAIATSPEFRGTKETIFVCWEKPMFSNPHL
jgi:hypothetical protein